MKSRNSQHTKQKEKRRRQEVRAAVRFAQSVGLITRRDSEVWMVAEMACAFCKDGRILIRDNGRGTCPHCQAKTNIFVLLKESGHEFGRWPALPAGMPVQQFVPYESRATLELMSSGHPVTRGYRSRSGESVRLVR